MSHINPPKPGDPPFDYETVPWLHVYPQYSNHSELKIIGNPAALLGLAAALQMAVENGNAECDGFVKDGEGYEIIILRTNMTGLRYSSLPYTADWCRELKTDLAEPHPENTLEAFNTWWVQDCGFGMTQSEAVKTFTIRLNAKVTP